MSLRNAIIAPASLVLGGAALPLGAQGYIVNAPYSLRCDRTRTLTARYHGISTEPGTWRWSASGGAACRVKPRLAGARTCATPDEEVEFLPPQVDRRTACRVTLERLRGNLPVEAVWTEILVLPAHGGGPSVRVTASLDPAVLTGGRSCLLSATHQTAPGRKLSWSIVEETLPGSPGGTAPALLEPLEDGRIRFLAPVRGQTAWFQVHAVDPVDGFHRNALTIVVEPPVPSARMRIAGAPAAPAALVTGETCLLQAVHEDPAGRSWHWSVLDGEGLATGTEGSGPAFAFTAPFVARRETFRVRVEDKADPGEFFERPIPVEPGSLVFRKLMAAAMGADWLPPLLVPFAGEYLAAPGVPASRFDQIQGVQFADDPLLAPWAAGYWVHDAWGLHHVDLHGVVSPVLASASLSEPAGVAEGTRFRITAMAVRPAGSSAKNPRRLVFAAEALAERATGSVGAFLFELDGKGRAVHCAGGLPPIEGHDGPENLAGDAAKVHLGRIGAMAMDLAGNLYLADAGLGLIRRVSPAGRVANLKPKRWFSAGAGDCFGASWMGLALDPGTGALYVADGPFVRRLGPEGDLSTACRCHARITGLAFHDGRLFLSAEGRPAIGIFDTLDRGWSWVALETRAGEAGVRLALLDLAAELPGGNRWPVPGVMGVGPEGVLVVADADRVKLADLAWVPRQEPLARRVPEAPPETWLWLPLEAAERRQAPAAGGESKTPAAATEPARFGVSLKPAAPARAAEAKQEAAPAGQARFGVALKPVRR